MTILIVPKIGGFFIRLFTGRKTKPDDEMRHDNWVSRIVGYIAVIAFLVIWVLLVALFTDPLPFHSYPNRLWWAWGMAGRGGRRRDAV